MHQMGRLCMKVVLSIIRNETLQFLCIHCKLYIEVACVCNLCVQTWCKGGQIILVGMSHGL